MADIRAAVSGHPALAGRTLHWHVPARPQDTPAEAERAAQAAAAAGGVVLAVGGDGTINAAAHACRPNAVPLGVICQGTFNFFSRQQGIPADVAQAITHFVQALEAGQARPVRPATVNGQTFLVNASLGLYPRLLSEREAATRQFGRHRIVAVVAGFLSLLKAQRGQVLRLRERDTQGRERQRMTLASTLFVGSNALQLRRVGVPEADQASHGLVATTLAPRPWLSMIALLWQAAFGRLGSHEAVDSFACTALTVEAAGWRLSQQVRVAFDGERTWMRLPLRFTMADTPVWLVAPEPAQQAYSLTASQGVVPANDGLRTTLTPGGALARRTADA
jgi:diacylglycerol kinase family enzyme